MLPTRRARRMRRSRSWPHLQQTHPPRGTGSHGPRRIVARHGARVRGVLSAVLRPAALPQLIRENAFNEVRVQRGRLEFFSECLSECLS